MKLADIQIKKILYATDLSETAVHAFSYAVSLAKMYDASITILHVLAEFPGEHFITNMINSNTWKDIKSRHYSEVRESLTGKVRNRGAIKEVLQAFSEEVVADTQAQADVTDDEFWERTGKDNISVVLLALTRHEQNLGITRRIRSRTSDGHIFAVVQYPEDAAILKAAGVEGTWNLYAEAGNGFADEVVAYFGETLDQTAVPAPPPQSPAGA